MSKITSKDIQHLGRLARIGLDEDLAQRLAPQLAHILEYVEQLQAVATDTTPITAQVTDLVDVWREDEVVSCALTTAELLQNAPEQQDGSIRVRRVKQ